MDPLQRAYQPGFGLDDALIDLLHQIPLSHLGVAGRTVRTSF